MLRLVRISTSIYFNVRNYAVLMLIDIQMHCDEQNYVDTNAVTDPGWGLKAFYGTFFWKSLSWGFCDIKETES